MMRKLAWSIERVFTTAIYGSGDSLEHLRHLYLVHKLQNQRASHIASKMTSLKHCPQKRGYQSHLFIGWVA